MRTVILQTLIIVSLVCWSIPLAYCNDKAKSNVFLIVLDTVRADHLGIYGYKRDTSPALDAFAKQSTVFDYAITPAPWTPAALASIFTGLYVSSHQVMPPSDREKAKSGKVKLHSNLKTVAEILLEQGYKTIGLTPNPWMTEEFGYNQGFQEYVYTNRADAKAMTDLALEKLHSYSKEKQSPLFLYLHYLDPHDPYAAPTPYNKMFVGKSVLSSYKYSKNMLQLLEQYDGEIRYMDSQLQRLFEYLQQEHWLENSLFIIVGDHGEQFMEHGDHRHGFKVYNEEVRVPLIVRVPNLHQGARIDTVVSSVDILPSIMSILKINLPQSVAGISLFDEKALAERRGVMSEIHRHYAQKAFVNNAKQKLILELKRNISKLDFYSSDSIWAQKARVLGTFSGYYDQPWKSQASSLQHDLEKQLNMALERKVKLETDEKPVSNETLDQLRSLGYLQ